MGAGPTAAGRAAAPGPDGSPPAVPTQRGPQAAALPGTSHAAAAGRAPAGPAHPHRHGRLLGLVREAALLVTLLLVYSGARFLASKDVPSAFAHAGRVLSWEQWLHLPKEQHVQHLLLLHLPVTRAANTWYALAHASVTGMTLVWLFLRHPAHYRWARTALVGATAAALLFYVLLPVAPPRMLPGLGFVDTAQQLGQSVYGAADGHSLANQYAAMPSLHVGWSVLVAVVGISALRSRWRWTWLLHPLVTVLVVVGTANHYWLDGIVGTALVAGALGLARRPGARPAIGSGETAPGRTRPAAAVDLRRVARAARAVLEASPPAGAAALGWGLALPPLATLSGATLSGATSHPAPAPA